MQAVVRETRYEADRPIQETQAFQEFQEAHAKLAGYKGTVVVDAGEGRYLTFTLWASREEMKAAQEAMGTVVGRTIDPLMTAPAVLLGTGPVVVNDLTKAP